VKTLSGKYITINPQASTIESVALIAPYDRPAKNGVLHEISGVISGKYNTWDYITNTNPGLKQAQFILSLNRNVFDINNSVSIRVNANGQTVYDSAWISYNSYFANVAAINDESAVFTYVLLTDNAFNSGFTALRPYSIFNTLGKPSSDSLTSLNVCSDLAFNGKYTSQNLPDTLISTTGVKVHINTAYIKSITETSNGSVILLDIFPVNLPDKIKPIIIQGEDTTGRSFSTTSDFRNVVKRPNAVASGGFDMIYNLGVTGTTAKPPSAFWAQFTANKIYSTTYKIYWVATNYTYDAKNAITSLSNTVDTVITYFNQSLAIYKYKPGSKDLPFVTLPQTLVSGQPTLTPIQTTSGYVETYLGNWLPSQKYDAVSLRVTGVVIKATTVPATTPASTTPFPTAVSVDYIKMVPVIQ
jgi:hypothetical protein